MKWKCAKCPAKVESINICPGCRKQLCFECFWDYCNYCKSCLERFEQMGSFTISVPIRFNSPPSTAYI